MRSEDAEGEAAGEGLRTLLVGLGGEGDEPVR
jgi:hypothetical protein